MTRLWLLAAIALFILVSLTIGCKDERKFMKVNTPNNESSICKLSFIEKGTWIHFRPTEPIRIDESAECWIPLEEIGPNTAILYCNNKMNILYRSYE
jgi:hypothetical protein